MIFRIMVYGLELEVWNKVSDLCWKVFQRVYVC